MCTAQHRRVLFVWYDAKGRVTATARSATWRSEIRPFVGGGLRAAITKGLAGQLHSSSNGGSLGQGRIDGLLAPPPLDAAKPLDAAPLLDVDGVDTLGDP
jgi:hypothetical protein